METKEKEMSAIEFMIDVSILNVGILILYTLLAGSTTVKIPAISLILFSSNISYLIVNRQFSAKILFLSSSFYLRFIRITKRTLSFIALFVMVNFLVISTPIDKFFLLPFFVLFYIGQLSFYWVMCQYQLSSIAIRNNVNHSVIIGKNPTGYYLQQIMNSNPSLGYKFIGFIAAKNEQDNTTLGGVAQLSNLIELHQIHSVFVTVSVLDNSFGGNEFLKVCNKKGIKLRFVPEKQQLYKLSNSMECVSNLKFINPQEIPLDNDRSQWLKRSFDIVFSAIVIVFLLSWLLPIVALLIKLSSKGPVFFIQKRTCLHNRVFDCYKFRSMEVNEQADTQQATDCDTRITKLGAILRKTNIDELPQFYNVLMGHMSVIGPRPHMLKHTQLYSEFIDYYQVRHHVKPGITGWAQVNGLRGETDELWKMEKRVEYDVDYIQNWNFWWDIRIIVLTLVNMKYFLPPLPESKKTAFYDSNTWQLRKLNDV